MRDPSGKWSLTAASSSSSPRVARLLSPEFNMALSAALCVSVDVYPESGTKGETYDV